MSYYALPSIIYNPEIHLLCSPEFYNDKVVVNETLHINETLNINETLHINESLHINETLYINKTLHKYLTLLKKNIEDCEDNWDRYKKYTNPYEFIHTVVPNTRNSICVYKPLSRSFYKMVELCNMMNILHELPKESCKSFHLAEGPGGFIEAIVFLRKNVRDTYYGMTLIDDNPNVPGWRKSRSFLEKNSNVIIEKGIDGTGDLLNPQNLLHCLKHYRNNFDLITGDGGIDFSVNYDSQESDSSILILSQISFAIATQKTGGTLIIKMFDTFNKVSLDIIYLLSNIYETVYFVKPNTSRYANSEKYLVCKKFRLDEGSRQDIINVLYRILLETYGCKKKLSSLFSHEIPYFFVRKIEEYNSIFGQQQLENINNTFNLIYNVKYDKLDLIKKQNIQKCINWCIQYNMDYYTSIQPNNIFLDNRVVTPTITVT